MNGAIIFATSLIFWSSCFCWTPLTDSNERDEIDWWASKYQSRLQQSLRAFERQGENMRLPRSVLPVDYYVRLLPYIEVGKFTTDGYVEIVVNCTVPTVNISMNGAELTINQSTIIVIILNSNY